MATPFTAVTIPPDSVPEPGFVEMVAVTTVELSVLTL